MPIARPLLK